MAEELSDEEIAHLESLSEEDRQELMHGRPVPRADRATKAAFAKRLGELVHGRGIRQADLARKSGLEPYLVSNYMLGRSMPGRVNLLALAKALNVEADSLMPAPRAEQDMLLDASPMALAVNPNNPSRANLRINMTVRTELGAEIIRLLLQDQGNLDKAG